MNRMAVLGPQGTNGHEAAQIALRTLSVFDASQRDMPLEFCSRNADVLRTVSLEKCFGIVPVENGREGVVLEVIRGFWMESEMQAPFVIGEVILPVSHSLLVHPSIVSISEIEGVMSHPQALAQCTRSLDRLRIDRRDQCNSTALAARIVSTDPGSRRMAAIASSFAGELYGLRAFERNLEDIHGNATRFHVIGPQGMKPTGSDKTAIVFWVNDEAGALCYVLELFREHKVNMSSIVSMPLGTLGSYAFYCEFGCHIEDATGALIMDELQMRATKVLVLGSYPRAPQVLKGGES